jgi:hypothetical protein
VLVINLYATYRPRSRLASYLPALRRIKQAGGGDNIKGLEGFEAAVRAAASDGAFRCGAFGLAAAPGAPRAAGLAASPTVCGPQPPASLPRCLLSSEAPGTAATADGTAGGAAAGLRRTPCTRRCTTAPLCPSPGRLGPSLASPRVKSTIPSSSTAGQTTWALRQVGSELPFKHTYGSGDA